MAGTGLTVARVWGIPIKLHFSLLLALPFLAIYYDLITAVGIFASIALHELGHSIVAMRRGCRVREILLTPIGGAARMERMPRRPFDEILMALAGPMVSLALFALLFFGGAKLPLEREPFGAGSSIVFLNPIQILGIINLVLAAFNLVPAFPMDGGRILRAILVLYFSRLRATLIAARVGQILAVAGAIFAVGHHRFMLLAVAIFVFWAAEMEYRMVRAEERMRQAGFWWMAQDPEPPPATDDRVVISPPPYRRDGADQAEIKPL